MSKEIKILILFCIIYFFLSWLITWTYFVIHADVVAQWKGWHEAIPQAQFSDSNQFRLVSYWLAEGISRVFSQPVFASYLILRFVVTFFTFCIFHLFLLKWFDHQKAFTGTVFLAAILPATFLPIFQESDMVLYPVFLAGLWTIREKKLIILGFIILLGTFIKETIVFLIPFYLILYWRDKKTLRLLIESCGLILIWVFAFYVTRYILVSGHNNSIWQLPYNLKMMSTLFLYNPLVNQHLLYLPFFGIFWILPFVGWRSKLQFFQRAAIFIVVFTVLHFIAGWPEEIRIMVPLAFLVIPSSLMVIFPNTKDT